MATNDASVTETVRISSNWQIVFVAATVLGWLSAFAEVLYTYATVRYFSAGTWAFQLSALLMAPLFFVISYLMLSAYGARLRRLFMACLAGAIGTAAYTMLQGWETRLWYGLIATQPVGADDTSWWTAYGNNWVVMALGLIGFAAILHLATHKPKR